MNDIKKFVAQWSGRGYEKGEMQPFRLSFLRDVPGVSESEKFLFVAEILGIFSKHKIFRD